MKASPGETSSYFYQLHHHFTLYNMSRETQQSKFEFTDTIEDLMN